ELDGHCPEHELQGQAETVPEDVILTDQSAVVVESDEATVTTRQREMQVGEAGPYHVEEGTEENDDQQGDRRHQQESRRPAVEERMDEAAQWHPSESRPAGGAGRARHPPAAAGGGRVRA